jgi:signal transduction histidine kinase
MKESQDRVNWPKRGQDHWLFWPVVFGLLSTLITALNVLLGPHVQLSFLFIVPVMLTAWFSGQVTAILLTGLLVAARLYVALFLEESVTPVWAAWVNAGIRLGSLLLVIQLVTFARAKRDAVVALSRKLIEVREQEQHRLSRELHDDVGQLLALAKLNLNSALETVEGKESELLNHSQEALHLATDRVKNLSRGLRPASLDGLGLAASLRQLFISLQAQTGVEVHFHDEVGDRRFAEELETHCYRIVQEALTNCLKHAEAGNVWVSLVSGDEEIGLEIQDDGNGFDVDSTLRELQTRGSLGLLGMRERAEMLGGELRVVSTAGEGTMIRCRIPTAETGQGRSAVVLNSGDVKAGLAVR